MITEPRADIRILTANNDYPLSELPGIKHFHAGADAWLVIVDQNNIGLGDVDLVQFDNLAVSFGFAATVITHHWVNAIASPVFRYILAPIITFFIGAAINRPTKINGFHCLFSMLVANVFYENLHPLTKA